MIIRIWALIGRFFYQCLKPYIYRRIKQTSRTRILLVRNNEVLLVKNWLGSGHWALPGGGVKRSESPEQAVVREVHEETGVTIKADAVISLGMHTQTIGTPITYHLFAYDIHGPKSIRYPKREIVAVQWASIDSIAGMHVSQHVSKAASIWKQKGNFATIPDGS